MLMTPFSLREICCHATTGGEQINALWCNGMAPSPNEGRAHAIASVITMMRDSGAFLRNGKQGDDNDVEIFVCWRGRAHGACDGRWCRRHAAGAEGTGCAAGAAGHRLCGDL